MSLPIQLSGFSRAVLTHKPVWAAENPQSFTSSATAKSKIKVWGSFGEAIRKFLELRLSKKKERTRLVKGTLLARPHLETSALDCQCETPVPSSKVA